MYLPSNHKGFTLIELIVVIALMSVVLFLILPRFQTNLLINKSKKASLWLMVTVQGLKQTAIREQKDYMLHISLDTGKMWTSHSAMKDEELTTAEKNAFYLPEGLRIVDIEYIDNRRITFGTATIHIYKEGYTDKVLIHMADENNQALSFLIEPFLATVKRYEEYVSFD